MSEIIPNAFLLLAISHALALLTPGQDFMLLLTGTLRHGSRHGRHTVLGIAIGNLAYISLVILLGAGIREYPLLFALIRWAGIAYLAWLGLLLLRSHRSLCLVPPPEAIQESRHGIWLGLGSSLLNPKNALFYLSLMSAILGPGITLSQQLFAGLWMALIVLLWNLLLVHLLVLPALRTRLYGSLQRIEQVAGGLFLILAGGLVMTP
ncbi:LysE family translocator [Aeromonas simiae]|nr:LysE family translocator [Aeromonas simiae]